MREGGLSEKAIAGIVAGYRKLKCYYILLPEITNPFNKLSAS